MRLRRLLVTSCLPILVATSGARAQEPPIRFRLGAEGTDMRPGGTLVLTVTARIPRGWHLYGMRQAEGGPLPTRIEVGPEPPFSLAAAVGASGTTSEFDPNFGQLVEWYADSAAFRVPLRASRATLPGTYDAHVRVSYQRCNDRICLPLTTDTLRAPIVVGGTPESPQATSDAAVADGQPAQPAAADAGRESRPLTLAQSGSRQTPGEPAIGPAAPQGAGASPGSVPGAQAGLVARYLVLGAVIVVCLLLLLLVVRWLAWRRR